jgi:isopenicillin N synthase-like dioxygenase
MISRITRENYRSSTHRVINKNPTDRYSVVFFFDGNVDYKLRPLDRVGQDSDEEDVLTVEEHMVERTTTTYKHKAK